MQSICASCAKPHDPHDVWISNLFNRYGDEFELCESCFIKETQLIDCIGTNDLPKEIARYNDNIINHLFQTDQSG